MSGRTEPLGLPSSVTSSFMESAVSMSTGPIRRSTIVRSDQTHTFDVFVRKLGEWWPLQPYSLGEDQVDGVTFTPHLGGRIYETRADWSTATWGHVLVWEPPERFAMSWEVFAGGTEVEVCFRSLGLSLTSVELEHRGCERLSEQELRDAVNAYGAGWSAILAAFATAAGIDQDL